MNRLRCFGASLIYYKLLALGSSMFSQILCQQIANELEKKIIMDRELTEMLKFHL